MDVCAFVRVRVLVVLRVFVLARVFVKLRARSSAHTRLARAAQACISLRRDCDNRSVGGIPEAPLLSSCEVPQVRAHQPQRLLKKKLRLQSLRSALSERVKHVLNKVLRFAMDSRGNSSKSDSPSLALAALPHAPPPSATSPRELKS
eukprot:6188972-Pleurochrysis_carterae.AAC.1